MFESVKALRLPLDVIYVCNCKKPSKNVFVTDSM